MLLKTDENSENLDEKVYVLSLGCIPVYSYE